MPVVNPNAEGVSLPSKDDIDRYLQAAETLVEAVEKFPFLPSIAKPFLEDIDTGLRWADGLV